MGKKKPEIAETVETTATVERDVPEPAKEPEQDIITALQADNLRISGELQVAKERIDKLALVVLQNWGKVI